MSGDLMYRLHALSRYEHDDASIGDEAAHEIARLMAVVSHLNGQVDHLGIRLGEVIRERDVLRAWAGCDESRGEV